MWRTGTVFRADRRSYADMQNWLDKLATLPQAEQQRLQSLPLAAQNSEYARLSGRDEFVIQRGVSRDALGQCLADPAKIAALDKVRKDAFEKYNVQGDADLLHQWRDRAQCRVVGGP